MPLVKFIKENKEIDVPHGANLRQEAIKAGIKVAVAAGSARRFLAGDPEHQWVEVLSGKTLDTLALVEKLGMRLLGENPVGFEKNGKALPQFEYAMTKEERSNLSSQSNR